MDMYQHNHNCHSAFSFYYDLKSKRCLFNTSSFKYQKYHEISKEGWAKVNFQKIRRNFEKSFLKVSCQKIFEKVKISSIFLVHTPQVWISNVDFFSPTSLFSPHWHVIVENTGNVFPTGTEFNMKRYFCLQKSLNWSWIFWRSKIFVKTWEWNIINHLGVLDKRQKSVTVCEKCENWWLKCGKEKEGKSPPPSVIRGSSYPSPGLSKIQKFN